MIRSLSHLSACFLIVGFLTLSVPRITPPGGLVGFDFLLMCVLPIGAYSAGKHWHNGPVFLFYGTVGMITFIPGFLADGRLGLKYAYGRSTPIGDVIVWTVGVLCVAIVCNVAGKMANGVSRNAAILEEDPQYGAHASLYKNAHYSL